MASGSVWFALTETAFPGDIADIAPKSIPTASEQKQRLLYVLTHCYWPLPTVAE
jgi:hypothetical protein